MTTERVNVLVASDAAFAKVLKRITRAGVKVEQALPEIGVVTGTIASEKLSALESLAGVEAVEHERTIQLPSSDSEVQ